MIRIKTDISKARIKLRRVRVAVTGTLPGVIESEGRLIAISLAKSTQPYGTGADAKLVGEKAVSRDIARVYATPGSIYANELLVAPNGHPGSAKQFWYLVHIGKPEVAMELLLSNMRKAPIGKFDGGALHRAARNARGRVLQTSPGMVVIDSKRLDAYKKEKMALVGFAKSAWAAIARELGGIRGLRAPKLPSGESDITANWITRKNAPHSVDRQYADRSRARLVMTSKVPYASHVLSAPAIAAAIRIARERIIRQMQIAASYEARRAAAA